ncbi:MAG: hypothetical protein QOJ43_969 [Gaiellaceae bacterium]|jgi:hypothetical protein|nr:hypothetical protein [Gaiellaceae bacterium]
MSWLITVSKSLAGAVKDVLGREKPEKKPKATEPASDPRASMAKIREDLRRLGATLATGATALLAGLGWLQIHNVFPTPASHGRLLTGIALAGSLAALVGVGWLVQIIFSAQRRIPVSSDVGTVGDLGLKGEELNIRNHVFQSAAVAQGEPNETLRQLELDARQAERDAEDPPTPDDGEKSKVRAARLDAAVDNAVASAALLILERRSAAVFRGWRTKVAFALAAVGIVLAFGVADYSKGQRDLIALRKSCAEAVAAGAKDACSSVAGSPVGPVVSGKESASTGTATVLIGVRRGGSGCVVTVRVDGKQTRAVKAGLTKLTIADHSRLCGARLEGGGLTFGSPWRHTGTREMTIQLKPSSYRLVSLRVRPGTTPTVRESPLDPLVGAP